MFTFNLSDGSRLVLQLDVMHKKLAITQYAAKAPVESAQSVSIPFQDLREIVKTTKDLMAFFH